MRDHLLGVVALLLMAAVSSTLANHRNVLTNYGDTCRLYFHYLDVESDGCVGEVPVLSCYGRCQSTAVPKFYTSRRHVPQMGSTVDSYNNTGSCCTATRRELGEVPVNVFCSDGSNKTIKHFAGTAVECGCSKLS